ncbi:MAG TPA: hypothetical protein VHA52_03690, partial [Candidatus Babeliaceae bacterium]|nr:hypothetical protein [Candidatus Babeliaceae bacterium]
SRVNTTVSNYLNGLLQGTALKDIICALPQDLRIIGAATDHLYPSFKKKKTADHKVIENLFITSVYNGGFNKLDFIKKIDLDTCAYCNRSYIYHLSGNGKRPIKPQIDHFLPKAKYPYLGLSFYNLIPSCAVCNSPDAKGEYDPVGKEFKSPYEIADTDDFVFSYKADDIAILSPVARKYAVTVQFKKKIDENTTVLKLEPLYQQHSDHVLELIIKSKGRYAQAYRKYLESYKAFRFDDLEIDRMILGNYAGKEELHKRPLAKLYQDIGRELKLIK